MSFRRYDPRTSYRPGFVRWMTLGLWVIALVWLAMSFGDTSALLRQLPFISLFLVIAPLALFWLPRVDVDAESVTITNIFRVIHIPFARIQSVNTRFVLEIVSDGDRKFTVWCAPAGSGRQAVRSSTKQRMGEITKTMPRDTKTIKSSELPGTDSGNAALLVGRALGGWLDGVAVAAERESSPGAVPTELNARAEVSVRWNIPLMTAAVACLLACFVSLGLT